MRKELCHAGELIGVLVPRAIPGWHFIPALIRKFTYLDLNIAVLLEARGDLRKRLELIEVAAGVAKDEGLARGGSM